MLSGFGVRSFLSEKITLRAIRDFDPKQITTTEERELGMILEKRRLFNFFRVYESYDADKHVKSHVICQRERHRHEVEMFERKKHNAVKYEEEG